MDDNSNNKSNERHRSDHDNRGDDEEMMREEGSGVGGSRWNPTKEQIEMLERMYSNEGVRTPSAEQIQHITARLRVYGHIEGKNVFYWFQNHKARQRQKQRQERLAAAAASANNNRNHHFNLNVNLNYHHNHGMINQFDIIPSPYYKLPQTTNDLSYNHHHHNALMKRSSLSTNNYNNVHNPIMELPPGNGRVPHGSTLTGYCAAMMNCHYENNQGRETMINCMGTRTLDLFPVHPTGILEHKLGMSSTNNSTVNSPRDSSSSDTNTFGDDKHQRVFDFFSSGHASCESN
ncbi:uncharacterized protein LOC141620849 [Silene latifolia]|uniref:uncharacterized protein LOC141620849 n=1 Tax=Silene latifolia TaxID=37657 RepID=UPI003D77AF8F